MNKFIYIGGVCLWGLSLYLAFDYGVSSTEKSIIVQSNHSLIKSAEWVFLQNQRLSDNLVQRDKEYRQIELENDLFEKELRDVKKTNKHFNDWANTPLPSDVAGLLNYSH